MQHSQGQSIVMKLSDRQLSEYKRGRQDLPYELMEYN